MTFQDWVWNTKERFYTEPLPEAVRVSKETFIEGVNRRLGRNQDREAIINGTNIYDLPEWDVLIVLDACRPDILRQTSRSYPWLETTKEMTYTSLGGYSKHWLVDTFAEGYKHEMQQTAFVAWNPYTYHVDKIRADDFATLKEIHETGWSDDYGCVPPSAITDAGLDVLDVGEKTILWYQQPHTPYRTLLNEVQTLTQEIIGNEDNGRLTVWNLLRRNEISEYEAVLACAETLRWCLDDLERLLAELPTSATVAVTSDHGELFGQDGRYGHPKENYREEQLQVPYMPIDQSKVDEEPDFSSTNRKTAEDVGAKLEALGYR